MVILPLKCKKCGRRVDLPSDKSIPKCEYCGDKMVPAGKVVEKNKETSSNTMQREYPGMPRQMLDAAGNPVTMFGLPIYFSDELPALKSVEVVAKPEEFQASVSSGFQEANTDLPTKVQQSMLDQITSELAKGYLSKDEARIAVQRVKKYKENKVKDTTKTDFFIRDQGEVYKVTNWDGQSGTIEITRGDEKLLATGPEVEIEFTTLPDWSLPPGVELVYDYSKCCMIEGKLSPTNSIDKLVVIRYRDLLLILDWKHDAKKFVASLFKKTYKLYSVDFYEEQYPVKDIPVWMSKIVTDWLLNFIN